MQHDAADDTDEADERGAADPQQTQTNDETDADLQVGAAYTEYVC